MSEKYNVYVIALKSEYYEKESKAKKENPNYIEGKPCVYVGYTAHSPEERYQQHLNKGISKTGKAPANKKRAELRYKYMFKKNGLRPRQYQKYNPIFGDRKKAEKIEIQLAEKLRKKGYCVWQA